jgi:hypothetical protein
MDAGQMSDRRSLLDQPAEQLAVSAGSWSSRSAKADNAISPYRRIINSASRSLDRRRKAWAL